LVHNFVYDNSSPTLRTSRPLAQNQSAPKVNVEQMVKQVKHINEEEKPTIKKSISTPDIRSYFSKRDPKDVIKEFFENVENLILEPSLGNCSVVRLNGKLEFQNKSLRDRLIENLAVDIPLFIIVYSNRNVFFIAEAADLDKIKENHILIDQANIYQINDPQSTEITSICSLDELKDPALFNNYLHLFKASNIKLPSANLSQAQFTAAIEYLTEDSGFELDKNLAIFWARKAAETGCVQALDLLLELDPEHATYYKALFNDPDSVEYGANNWYHCPLSLSRQDVMHSLVPQDSPSLRLP
jgi:hypothetical protein